MGDETVNSVNLDLNLGPLPEPEDELMSLVEFMNAVSQNREHLRQREIQPLGQSDSGDLLIDSFGERELQVDQRRERLRQREMQPLEQSDDQLRERLIARQIHSLRRSNAIDRIGESLSVRARPRSRSFGGQAVVPPAISRNVASELETDPVRDPSSSFVSGQASVTPFERDAELLKVTKNKNEINVDNEEIAEKRNEDKDKDNDDEEGSFFDCNICLDLAKEPVVTCCGHLFCWPCIYQWLNLHSGASECPVCKGEVTMKNLTPIYGRGNSLCGTERDQIPVRPHARRVESVRQSILRNSVSTSIDELVRHLSERTGTVRRDQVAGGANVALPRNASSERITNYFIRRHREEQPPPLDDRDSVSSIAAVIQSESQTIDPLEIDSNVYFSTSTSRRRNRSNASRASDVDTGDSRTHRRRMN